MAQPTFKKIEGEEYLYEATYPSGTKKYAVRGSKSGVPGIKQYFPFTAAGLNAAKKRRNEWLTESNKILAKKRAAGETIEPAVRKLKNPPDPKKPWKYLRSGSRRGEGKSKKNIVEYFATEAEAKAAQAAAKKAKKEAQTKIRQSDFADIKKLIKEGKTREQIAKTYKADESTIARLLKDNNTSYSELTPNKVESKVKGFSAYLNDPKALKYIEKNYGKLKGETMGKALYPDLPASTQESRVRKLVAKLIDEKKIKAIPAALVEEYREEKGFNPEESAKKVSADRVAKIKKFSVPAFERAMEGSKASQLSHMDDLKSQIVRFETLGYSPQRINQEVLKNVDPYLNQLYKERDKLFKNKPKGYVKKIIEINNKGEAVARATKGYKSFKIEEPITRRTYSLGVDPLKTVDPFGVFEGKSIQEVSPKSFRGGTIKALERIIPDPVDRYFFIENAKNVQRAQAKISNTEINKIAQNLKDRGFDTDPYKRELLFINDVKADAVANGPICKIVGKKQSGGPVVSCVDAVDDALKKDPKKLAQDINKSDAGGAFNKIKNSSTKFLTAIKENPNILKGRFGALAALGVGTVAAGVGAGALVKQFRSDDPSTYLTDTGQMEGMLIEDVNQLGEGVEDNIFLDNQFKLELAGAAGLTAPIAGKVYRTARQGTPPLLESPLEFDKELKDLKRTIRQITHPDGKKAKKISEAGQQVIRSSKIRINEIKDIIQSAKAGKEGSGVFRSALGLEKGVLGKGLWALGAPIIQAPATIGYIAQDVRAGKDIEEIATNPLNYLGAAFMNPSVKALARAGASRGLLGIASLGLAGTAVGAVALPAISIGAGLATLGTLGYQGYKLFTGKDRSDEDFFR